MTQNIAELAGKFAIAGGVEFAETEHGLVKAIVSHGGMTGELFLQGAQVTGWQPAAQPPVIFLSNRANLAPGKAIRGGIPIVFPWFGPHPSDPQAPQHGLARTAPWRLDSAELVPQPEGVGLQLSLAVEGFALTYRVVFGSELHLSLAVRNTGASVASCEEALHSYFAVSDVERVTVSGLEGSGFIDKAAGMRRCPPAGTPLSPAQETDSVYLDTPDAITVHDPGRRRRITVLKSGAASTIVWNPWPEKAAAMADLGVDNWRGFLCVESGNVADNRVSLPPGGVHEMTVRIVLDAS
jgi:glucose-6-phosphate 1-epimerase